MPGAGPWHRRGHQDVHVQMLFCEVAESWAVDELDPIILLGLHPASRREPRCGDQNPPARAFLIHGADQLTNVTYTNNPRYLLAWTIVRPPTRGSRLMTTASTPSSPERWVVQPSNPLASNSCRTKCSNSVGDILVKSARESRPATTSTFSTNE